MGNVITKPSTKEKAHYGKDVLKKIDEREILGKNFKMYGTVEEPLFMAKDVAEWIDYAYKDNRQINRDVSKMLSTVDDEEKEKHTLNLGGEEYSHGGLREGVEVWFLTEEGLYEVLFQSRKPIAKAFKKQVKAILKELRTSGGYISNSQKFVEFYFGDEPEEVKSFMKKSLDSIEEKQKKILHLNQENDLLAQKVLEWADTSTINALIRVYGAVVGFETAWRDFKKELLYRYGINLNARITNYLNETGKKTKPKTLDMLHEDEIPQALSTATALCRDNNVDISGILERKAG